MEYETVIGLEVHSQLLTKSKMFCSCSANYQQESPNTVVCEVCMGMPGVLPVINRRAVELVITTGLALNCTIAGHTKFDRKNYPYPDLMKGYQISQYDRPISAGGWLEIDVEGGTKKIGVTRVHLEEDVAKLQHYVEQEGESYTLLDMNRAGVPLMETVSEPDMRSPEEARAYLMSLHTILRYVEVSTANMEEGSFRCDANISVRPMGTTALGSKVEVKNMNSFRAVYGALVYEKERQIRLVEAGKRIVQETRGWVDDRSVTVSQRSKEYASDYRYFPEPDLPPLIIPDLWEKQIRDRLPELPKARKDRFVKMYDLPIYDAGILTTSRATSDFFEAVMEVRSAKGEVNKRMAKAVSNWMLGEHARLLNESNTDIEGTKLRPRYLVELVELVEDGTLSTGMAKKVFEEMFNSGKPPRDIVEEAGMSQISAVDAVKPAVDQAIEHNPKPVADYLNGKETAMKFLVGQVMKSTKGQANPQVVAEMVKEALDLMK